MEWTSQRTVGDFEHRLPQWSDETHGAAHAAAGRNELRGAGHPVPRSESTYRGLGFRANRSPVIATQSNTIESGTSGLSDPVEAARIALVGGRVVPAPPTPPPFGVRVGVGRGVTTGDGLGDGLTLGLGDGLTVTTGGGT